MDAKVSVIVPVYNAEKYLRRSVDALLAQTLQDLQIILVDDGSKDTSGAICDEYAQKDARIHVIHQKNQGCGFARNSGLDAACGEYVGFADADDWVEPHMFESLYAAAVEHDADMVVAGMQRVDVIGDQERKEGFTVGGFDTLEVFSGEQGRKKLILGMVGALPHEKNDSRYDFAVWKNLYKNSVIQRERIRFISEREIMSEDIFFQIQFISHIKAAVGIPGAFYHYYRFNVSLSNGYRKDRFVRFKASVGEIRKRLQCLMPEQDFQLYSDRLLQSGARVALVTEIAHAGACAMPRTELKARLLAICTDEELQQTLQRYPYWKLPIQQAVFAFAMRWKLTALLRLLVWLKGSR